MLIKKAVCMHEEDVGTLWKHTEYRTGHSEVRRARKLKLSFLATIANYGEHRPGNLTPDGMAGPRESMPCWPQEQFGQKMLCSGRGSRLSSGTPSLNERPSHGATCSVSA